MSASLEPENVFFSSGSESEKNPAIILKEETHVELGHPSVGSCAVTLATHDSSLVRNGRITLVGPEINEVQGGMLPFVQAAVARCKGDVGETACEMDRTMHTSAPGNGYMLRSVPNMIWARVSKQAAESGFTIERLGRKLLVALEAADCGIETAELFFATSSRDDVRSIEEIVAPARETLRKVRTFQRNPDGSYQCDTSFDCNECPEKPVCDTIRDVITIRKGDRIIRFGGKEKE